MKHARWLITGLLLAVVLALAQANPAATLGVNQSSGALDTSFDPGAGANDIVFAVARQSDGQVLIGGQFTQVNNLVHIGIARLKADGSLDGTYTPSLTGTGFVGLTSIAIQPDGKAVVGGAFSQVNSAGRLNIARLNEIGILDTSFNPGSGVTGGDEYLNVVKLQKDGKVLIGGAFTTFNGTGRNNIARLTPAGALDTTFDPGTGANGEVNAIAIQPLTNQVLIGGAFTTVDRAPQIGLARLNANGSLDSTFSPVTNGTVLSIAVQTDTQILIGGTFTSVNDTPRFHLARLDTNGKLDMTFDPNASNDVEAILLQPDGKSLIGGKFTTLGVTPRIRIARLNTDGSVDTGFNSGPGATGGIPTVYALALQPDGKVLVGGGFQSVFGFPRNRIARLWGDKSLFLPLLLR